jgi:hypothetical protein
MTKTPKKPAAQVATKKARKAAKAAEKAATPFWQQQTPATPTDDTPLRPAKMGAAHRARGPPKKSALVERATAFKDEVGLRLLSKPEVLSITGASFPTIWIWMRDGKFPRSRIGAATRFCVAC